MQTRIVTLADPHQGRWTKSYNHKIMERRLWSWADQLGQLKDGTTPLAVFLLGDVNDGSGVFPGQVFGQEKPDPLAQASDSAKVLADLTNRLLQDWPAVTWYCVPGNHGGTGKHAHERANWDIDTFQKLQLHLGERATVRYPSSDDADPWMLRVRLNHHCYVLYHGHDLRSNGGVPWTGIYKRALLWHSWERYDGLFIGHWHKSAWDHLNNIVICLTGTLVSGDEWARRVFGYTGDSHCFTFLSTEGQAFGSMAEINPN